MTIPDLGHCAGSGAAPIRDTTDSGDPATGVCAACSGRFELRGNGTLSLHVAAQASEREDAPPPDRGRDDQ